MLSSSACVGGSHFHGGGGAPITGGARTPTGEATGPTARSRELPSIGGLGPGLAPLPGVSVRGGALEPVSLFSNFSLGRSRRGCPASGRSRKEITERARGTGRTYVTTSSDSSARNDASPLAAR